MSNGRNSLEPSFLEQRRRQLLALREQLRAASDAAEGEESALRAEGNQQAREFEEEGQKMDRLESEGALVSRTVGRLQAIDRALAKIEDGTYGYSEVSGDRIPDARLEAMPDATNTLAEQEDAERARRVNPA